MISNAWIGGFLFGPSDGVKPFDYAGYEKGTFVMNKALDVLDSCTRKEHVEVAIKYFNRLIKWYNIPKKSLAYMVPAREIGFLCKEYEVVWHA